LGPLSVNFSFDLGNQFLPMSGGEGMKVDGDAQISERFPLSIGGEG